MFGLWEELRDFERHVATTLKEVEVVRTFLVTPPIVLIHRLTQLREEARRNREEIQRILDDRSNLLNALNVDLTLALHIIVILVPVIGITFYVHNM